ncbi:MAG: hypothetical protein RRC34_02585 [Lentisphaeria bacterium]|nr:hypothetical protein [Lentisphaeria bacterium]
MKTVLYQFTSMLTRWRMRVFCVTAIGVMCLPMESPAGHFFRRWRRWYLVPPDPPPPPPAAGGPRRWTEPVGATVDLNVSMPAWTKGWLRAGVSWQDSRQLDEAADLNGRDIEAESHHVLLARTKAGEKGPHSWQGKELIPGDAWDKQVYQEGWASIDDLSGYSAGGNGESPGEADQEYKRFSTFVKWSD